MTISQLVRQWFLIGSVLASLSAIFLVGLFLTYETSMSKALVDNPVRVLPVAAKSQTKLQVAGEMISLGKQVKHKKNLPDALFASKEYTLANEHSEWFVATAPKQTESLTSPERALLCSASCEDVSLMFFLVYQDGTRITEKHARNGTVYAIRDELHREGMCTARYTIRFEDTIDSDGQVTDFDYNDIVLEVERVKNSLTVRPVYSEAANDVSVGVSLYRATEFDREIIVFDSLLASIQKESQRPGAGTRLIDVTPTMPDECATCTYACPNTRVTYQIKKGISAESELRTNVSACSAYERVIFTDDSTGEKIAAIDSRNVGSYVSFVPVFAAEGNDALSISVQVYHGNTAFETYTLYDDIAEAYKLEIVSPGSQLRIIDTTDAAPPLQCITLRTASCTPRCGDVDFSLVLVDSLGNELRQGDVIKNHVVSEREDVLWRSACEHSYIVRFDDPLSQTTNYNDVWVFVERTPTGITITPSQYNSTRDYRLVLDVTNELNFSHRYTVAPSIYAWNMPGAAAEPFSFSYNIHSDQKCTQGISWQ